MFFCGVNSHPLGRFLKQGFGHVWVAIKDKDRNSWLSYDWREGLPKICAEAPADYDLAGYYKGLGQKVVRVVVNENYSTPAIIVNNCVGHTKILLGIGGLSLTPWQLFKQLTSKGTTNEVL